MLNFRNTNIFFLLVLSVLIGLHVIYGIPAFVYGLLVLVYSLIVFYGCVYINSNFFLPVICSANTTEKIIAISFDDGPVENYTPQILSLLKQENIKAAFFCIGNRIAGNEKLVKQMVEDGHIIGNHSYSHHFWFDMFSSEKMLYDLQMMDNEIEKITGLRPRLFRPPYGVTNPNIKRAVEKGNYIPVGWSVRSMDTVIKEEKKLLTNICKVIKPGAVFLFHDTSITSLKVLQEFINTVKNKGYRIVPLDKMLTLETYA